jgi:Zn-dependent peptidase ImmA (M78 family)
MCALRASSVIPFAEAARVWELYGLATPRDLVLEDLALAMGVIVVEGRLDGTDARLVRRGGRGLIRVKETIPEPGRKRFAIAHELGHWKLHGRLSQVLACTSDDMVRKYQGSVPEIEANYFASALLMPEHLFGGQIRGRQPTFDLIKSLAGEFGTSITATAVRFAELSAEFCAVVVSEKGRVRWSRTSEAFDDSFLIEPGSLLPVGSVAAALFRNESPELLQELDTSEWLPDDLETEIESETIIEDARMFEKYGQVLSLLWIP